MNGYSLKVQRQASHRISADVAVMAQTVACASAACLAEVRDQLLAAGEIRVEGEPEPEDLEPGDDDAEMEVGDEDDERDAEGVVEDGECSPDDTPLFRKDVFEVQVVRAGDGNCRCEIPQCGWEGVVGVTGYGKMAVETVSARMRAYLRIAKWLEAGHQDFLRAGPSGFKGAFCSQRDLLDGPLKGVLGGSKDGGASLLSRCLRDVDLVWPEGAIQLRKCFGG